MESAIQLAAQYLLNNYSLEIVKILITITLPETESLDARREAILVLKKSAKANFSNVEPLLSELVPALMISVRDRNIPIKLGAERALVYALKARQGTDTIESFIKTLNGPLSRSIGDYARRVLVKIGERDSDGSDDDI